MEGKKKKKTSNVLLTQWNWFSVWCLSYGGIMPLSERLKENTGQYQMVEYVFKTNKLNFVYMIH